MIAQIDSAFQHSNTGKRTIVLTTEDVAAFKSFERLQGQTVSLAAYEADGRRIIDSTALSINPPVFTDETSEREPIATDFQVVTIAEDEDTGEAFIILKSSVFVVAEKLLLEDARRQGDYVELAIQ